MSSQTIPAATSKVPANIVSQGATESSSLAARRPMRRRRFWLMWFAVCGALLGLGAALLRHRPEFYCQRLATGDLAEQSRLSAEFLSEITALRNELLFEPIWDGEFQEPQINAHLAEKVDPEHAETMLPKEIVEPRVAMEGDRLRVGFRYAIGPIDAVVQFAVRVWVPKPNILVVELQGAWVGRLPLPTKYTQHLIEQAAAGFNLSTTWYRNGHRLAAVFEFPRGTRDCVLQQVEIRDRAIRIKGASSRFLYSDSVEPRQGVQPVLAN